ncbi:unnamed protein product [Adineta steineri]|uniref:IF rod domain-containing protein n=2 Tax=Adineta steineri TaxID=433720 RepID=A0A814I5T7_9BILA|nr:unnamed protein product [Adineta steineri]CAF1215025.1 unnamed protein product [Adineta steineri]
MADDSTNDETITITEEFTGIAPSNNFLGLLPPPYSMSALKSTLPLFQTSSLASSSSAPSSYASSYIPQTSTSSTPSLYTSSYIPQSSTSSTNNNHNHNNNHNNNNNNNNNNHLLYPYRSTSTLYSDSNNIGSSSSNYPMSSSTYRSQSFSIPKPSLFQQTREKEKLELSTLNDKFADYVEKVRYLEAQNKKVQMETNILTEKQTGNCQRVKSMFETEVAQLKEVIEKLFQDKNTTSYNAKEAQNGIYPLKQRLNSTFKECDSSKYETERIERQLSTIDGDILMFKRRLAHQDDEHTQWKQLITHIQRLILQAKNETQNETITRTTCEKTTQQLRVDINKLREQQQQKIKDLRQTTLLLAPSSTNDRAHIFKSELSSAIRKIRQDFERQNDSQRNELYGQFTQAYEDIARDYPELGHLFLNEREQERVKQEEDRARVDIQRVKADSNLLKQKTGELKLRTRELQINLEMSVEENARFEQLQQNEIDQLKVKQERISKDYEDVITKQTSLEKEIETYRNLLEGTMKSVVDTITDEYNTITTNQSNMNQQQQQQQQHQQQHQQQPQPQPQPQRNGISARAARSSSADRYSIPPYFSASRLNGHTNSYSRFMGYKQNGNETSNSVPVIDIPTTIAENGLTASKSVHELSAKNDITSSTETNHVTNGSSPPSSRPPTILQTRRS